MACSAQERMSNRATRHGPLSVWMPTSVWLKGESCRLQLLPCIKLSHPHHAESLALLAAWSLGMSEAT